MIQIENNKPCNLDEVNIFLESFGFKIQLPIGFLDFYKKSNGGYIYSEERYIHSMGIRRNDTIK